MSLSENDLPTLEDAGAVRSLANKFSDRAREILDTAQDIQVAWHPIWHFYEAPEAFTVNNAMNPPANRAMALHDNLCSIEGALNLYASALDELTTKRAQLVTDIGTVATNEAALNDYKATIEQLTDLSEIAAASGERQRAEESATRFEQGVLDRMAAFREDVAKERNKCANIIARIHHGKEYALKGEPGSENKNINGYTKDAILAGLKNGTVSGGTPDFWGHNDYIVDRFFQGMWDNLTSYFTIIPDLISLMSDPEKRDAVFQQIGDLTELFTTAALPGPHQQEARDYIQKTIIDPLITELKNDPAYAAGALTLDLIVDAVVEAVSEGLATAPIVASLLVKYGSKTIPRLVIDAAKAHKRIFRLPNVSVPSGTLNNFLNKVGDIKLPKIEFEKYEISFSMPAVAAVAGGPNINPEKTFSVSVMSIGEGEPLSKKFPGLLARTEDSVPGSSGAGIRPLLDESPQSHLDSTPGSHSESSLHSRETSTPDSAHDSYADSSPHSHAETTPDSHSDSSPHSNADSAPESAPKTHSDSTPDSTPDSHADSAHDSTPDSNSSGVAHDEPGTGERTNGNLAEHPELTNNHSEDNLGNSHDEFDLNNSPDGSSGESSHSSSYDVGSDKDAPRINSAREARDNLPWDQPNPPDIQDVTQLVDKKTTFPPDGMTLEPNSAYKIDGRGVYYTNEHGRVTVVDAEALTKTPRAYNIDLENPAPDTTYRVLARTVPGAEPHADVIYVTDHQARPVAISADSYTSDVVTSDRHHSQSAVGHLGDVEVDGVVKKDYQSGHIIAAEMGGIKEYLNLVPMHEKINMNRVVPWDPTNGNYREIELKAGNPHAGTSRFDVEFVYDADIHARTGLNSQVPTEIHVTFDSTEGKSILRSWQNYDPALLKDK